MQIKISVRHGHVSEPTQEKVMAKLERLTRYFERLTGAEVTIDLERREQPSVDLKISAEHRNDFLATASAENLLAAVDAVVEKMEQQLRKHKERVQDRHRNPGHRQSEVSSKLPSELE